MGGGAWVRVFLQAALKLVNSVIGLVGTGLILYSLWLIRLWYKDGLQTSASPWVCLQVALKLVNSVIGLVGMGIILYSLWLIQVWYKNSLQNSGSPWFMYTILSLGASFCLVTCFGHVAAETANGHCLSCYMIFVFSLVMLEAGITAVIFLNRNWEEDFPEDPSGRFNELKDFVSSNFELCKWIVLSFVAAEATVLVIALVLRVLGPDREISYDSDDDYVPARLPLLQNQAQQTSNFIDPSVFLKNKSPRA